MYVLLEEETGRICATTDKYEFAVGFTEFDFPEDFDFSIQNEYKIVDGELIHDPLPKSEEEIKMEEETKKRSQLESAIPMILQTVSTNLTDEQLMSVSLLFDEWVPGQKHKDGDIVRVGENVYRVIANVNKNNVAEPGTEEGSAYYKLISVTPEGVENWSQPSDKKSAYSKGDKVYYNGFVWESVKNNNMDEPGTSENWVKGDDA